MGYSHDLPLKKSQINSCRRLAKGVSREVSQLIKSYTTDGIERALLRLVGISEAIEKESWTYPLVNHYVDELRSLERLSYGVLLNLASLVQQSKKKKEEVIELLNKNQILFSDYDFDCNVQTKKIADQFAKLALKNIKKKTAQKKQKKKKLKDPITLNRPLLYQIVATGNIYEDVTQAQSSAHDGADVIAVIRSTAQSLLDYVPHGATTEGFGGTYATQENFRIMREALDQKGEMDQKYYRLTNYCSGLCMAEISVMAAFEGLDCLLNDAMYGILFRDINPIRTLVDQHFSRLICGMSDIWIMTGEDNYLKTTDAEKSGDQVLASEFINEITAHNANVKPEQMSLGHAMEMNPEYDQVILKEIARAQMTRQIFPSSPLKYMCNTKYKSGDIFTSHAIDTVFNFIGSLTHQGVLLLGMPTEAVHTPFLQDRTLSLRSATYVTRGLRNSQSEFGFSQEGLISRYAQKTLDNTEKLLNKIYKMGFLKAIEKGYFADVRRPTNLGKGKEGVIAITKDYYNPLPKLLGSLV